MFGNRVRLFSLLGFEVKVDLSWIIIAVLITWSLSTGLFPAYYKNLASRTYWFMGIVGALGLFLSIIVHEFSHSLVARRFGIPMKGITLFIFGGVAEMGEEPPSPKAEFTMAAVGPLSSIVIGLVFYAVFWAAKDSGLPESIKGIVGYLAFINLMLAAFNLLPAFPLDGGRVLRSILWAVKGNLDRATSIASNVGSGFGIFFVVLGVINVLTGNFIGGMWWFLIGLFLRNAAKASYQKLVTRKALEGESLERFVKRDPVTVSPSTSVAHLVEDFVYEHHFKMFPVVDNGNRLLGCVSTKQVKEIPREAWGEKTVADITQPCSEENTVSENTDPMEVLEKMNKTGSSRLMVVKGERLVGIIALKDMLQFLSLKIELGE